MTEAAAPGRRRRRRLIFALVLAMLAFLTPAIWTLVASAGHLYTVDNAPNAPVAIVFGAQLKPGGHSPKSFLAGRLATAEKLYRSGRVRALLVSGDAHGSSGNEVAVMTRILTEAGIPADRIVTDPDGLDTYDTCRRARDVYGVSRALLVSQRHHLYRAITLCHTMGLLVDGVEADCDHCNPVTITTNTAREILADFKAVRDVATNRPPAVTSPPDPALSRAEAG
jgi:vancomycin permeability regulator SanA